MNGGRDRGSARLGYAQTILQAVYAYAVPSPETIGWVANFCQDSPIVELGAGRGYWAAQLAHGGLIVDAYDSDPPDQAENVSFPGASGQKDIWQRTTTRTPRSPRDLVDDHPDVAAPGPHPAMNHPPHQQYSAIVNTQEGS